MEPSSFIEFLPLLFVGAVITGNIIGNMAQQLGKSFVFFRWKGINCVRTYVTPANPNTVPQQTQRAFFYTIISIATIIKISICQKFWKKFAIKMSSYNAFCSENLNRITPPATWNQWLFAKGAMTPLVLAGTSNYDPGSGVVNANFSPDSIGNQLPTDNIALVITGPEFTNVMVVDTGTKRTDGFILANYTPGYLPAEVYVHLFAYRNLGSVGESISNSVNEVCS